MNETAKQGRKVLPALRELCQTQYEMYRKSVENEMNENPCNDKFLMAGVTIQMNLFYSDRRSTRRSIIIEGHDFATEIERVPWNIFQPITISYTAYLDLPKTLVIKLINEAGVSETASPIEEFYPSDNGPLRYFAECDDMETVIKLWKVWSPTYKPE